MQKVWTILMLTLVAGWSATATAQQTGDDPPSPEDVARAEELYLEGMKAFQAGDADRAADLFHRSWELVPKPELLYNEAIARGDAGQVRRAHETAIVAGESELPPKMSVRNSARIDAWGTRLRGESVAAQIAAMPEPTPEPKPVAATEPPDQESTVEETGELEPDDSSGSKALGAILGGVGLAGLATAGILAWQVDRTGVQLDTHAENGDRVAYDEALRRGERLQTAGVISLISGAALFGTGAILWLASSSSERETTAMRVTFDGTAVTATIRFR